MAIEIPAAALALQVQVVEEAVQLAHSGRVKEGFRSLLASFERAQDEAEGGPAWQGELAARYQQALLSYAERHGIEP